MFIGTFLVKASELTASNRHLEVHLPSQSAGEYVQQEFRTVLPAAGLPAIQMTAERG